MNQLLQEVTHGLHIVFGVVSDKKLESIFPVLPKNAQYYFCAPNISRAMSSEKLCTKAAQFGLVGKEYLSVNEALSCAKTNAAPQDVIYVGGSTFVVAEIL